MPTVTTEYYGVSGTGRNVTEAKRDAGEKIKRALAGDYTPIVIAWRGNAILVHREPTGWHSSTIVNDDGIRAGHLRGTIYPSGTTREEAIASATGHVVQMGWKPEDGTEPPEILHRYRKERSDFREWAAFQLRYREAKRRGMNDNDAHSYAGRNPARPDLWLDDEPNRR
jgi:hypothetical protein